MTKRLLAAAKAKATNGSLKKLQLAYAEAANYYRQATELVEQMPVESEVDLASFSKRLGNRILRCWRLQRRGASLAAGAGDPRGSAGGGAS